MTAKEDPGVDGLAPQQDGADRAHVEARLMPTQGGSGLAHDTDGTASRQGCARNACAADQGEAPVPPGYVLLGSLDFLEDGETRDVLLRLSYVILGAAIVLGLVLGVAGAFDVLAEIDVLRTVTGLSFGLAISVWGVLLLVVSGVALPVHEFNHGACFKLLSAGRAKVTYGFSAGMLYAGCPGLVLEKARFCVVLLAPAVLVNAALLAAGMACGLPLLGYACFALHLAGCAGDLLACWRIVRTPGCTHCEDTATGLRLLRRNN